MVLYRVVVPYRISAAYQHFEGIILKMGISVLLQNDGYLSTSPQGIQPRTQQFYSHKNFKSHLGCIQNAILSVKNYKHTNGLNL
jgi:hypothetical protein